MHALLQMNIAWLVAPGWKGLRVSSIVHGYSWKIHDIHVPIHTEITCNAHHCPTPPRMTIVHAMHALPDVINIELSV